MPLILNNGASICISPHELEFISYYLSSKAKTCDLSQSNVVQGEGMMQLPVVTIDGEVTHIEVLGYHIPQAEVQILCPQVLLSAYGGNMDLTKHHCTINFDNGTTLQAVISHHNNATVLEMEVESKSTPWVNDFGFLTMLNCRSSQPFFL